MIIRMPDGSRPAAADWEEQHLYGYLVDGPELPWVCRLCGVPLPHDAPQDLCVSCEDALEAEARRMLAPPFAPQARRSTNPVGTWSPPTLRL